MRFVLSVEEWHELVATMLLLPHHHQTMLLVVFPAAICPMSLAKPMHNCMAVSRLQKEEQTYLCGVEKA